MSDQKNMILAIVISGLILLAWNFLYIVPKEQALKAEQARLEQQQPQTQAQPQAQPGPVADSEVAQLGVAVPSSDLDTPVSDSGADRQSALAATARVAIESGRLTGSIALTGARVDDLVLLDYREAVDSDSANIVLLHPTGTTRPYYAEFGWLGGGLKMPDRTSLWRADRDRLTPGAPVTLSWDNGEGLLFQQVFSLDENYLVTVEQRVRNESANAVTVNPYGLISRTGTPDILGFYILHEGLLGVFDGTLKELDYDDLEQGKPVQTGTAGGWLGITDKYWLVALIPDQDTKIATSFSVGERAGIKKYQADYMGPALTIHAGGIAATTGRLFAGAKEVSLLDKYEAEAGVVNFDKAVDFGWFYFLTKPIFYMLDWFYGVLGNFGLAILALTVVIKLLFFPLANKSYKAMSKMKLLGPKIKELRERLGDDRAKINQETMELYKREKVNPAAGCLPILVQIPVFFALYKVLFVTIEMRHTPFFGWIGDLSAPDPLGLLTGFGLVDWSVPPALAIVNIGIWPVLMGATMYFQQKLNPPPPDPTQAKIMMMLPFVFTFLLAKFPAGLVIYWTWNNLLSITQQWVIMRGVQRDAGLLPTAPKPTPEPAATADETPEPAPTVTRLTKPKPKKKRGR